MLPISYAKPLPRNHSYVEGVRLVKPQGTPPQCWLLTHNPSGQAPSTSHCMQHPNTCSRPVPACCPTTHILCTENHACQFYRGSVCQPLTPMPKWRSHSESGDKHQQTHTDIYSPGIQTAQPTCTYVQPSGPMPTARRRHFKSKWCSGCGWLVQP